jgi:hypothetical protein
MVIVVVIMLATAALLSTFLLSPESTPQQSRFTISNVNEITLDYSCSTILTGLSIRNVSGFVTHNVLRSDTENWGLLQLDEFVLEPNSTGYVTLEYFTRPGGNKTVDVITKIEKASNITEFFTSEKYLTNLNQEITFWNATGQKLIPASEVGIRISTFNVTTLNEDRVRVTYKITAEANAIEGTYGIRFWQRCIPSLLSIENYLINDNSIAS